MNFLLKANFLNNVINVLINTDFVFFIFVYISLQLLTFEDGVRNFVSMEIYISLIRGKCQNFLAIIHKMPD